MTILDGIYLYSILFDNKLTIWNVVLIACLVLLCTVYFVDTSYGEYSGGTV